MQELNLHTALLGSVRRLHHIQRYSSIPVLKPESVAAHSWQIAFISMLIGWDLAHRGTHVMMGDLLQRAICHDLNEAMSGDIIRSYKYSDPEVTRVLKGADEKLTHKLSREFGASSGDNAYEEWITAKDHMLEGHIVALADVLAVVTYCVEESRMGNSELDLILRRAYEQVLVPRFANHQYLGRYVTQIFPDGNYMDAYRRASHHTHEFTEPEA